MSSSSNVKNCLVQTSHKDPTVNLCIDSSTKNRQTLVFCSSKRGAESQAEKVAKAHTSTQSDLEKLAAAIQSTLLTPTKQCKRLAFCVKKGVAFHHSGVANKQRELIENAFRKGTIHTICSTPTLAAGLDLPAFRVIIRDYKRFGKRGMSPIQVLEYKQMAGRAGRPLPDMATSWGEAILLATDNTHKDELYKQFIYGNIEPVYSKLAVEPVLRTYLLSLISTEMITTVQEAYTFFNETFYAHQFGDVKKLQLTIRRMISLLVEWNMITTSDESFQKEQSKESLFQSAKDIFAKEKEKKNAQLEATNLGRRVSEMYLDPLTAFLLIEALEKANEQIRPKENKEQTIELIHLITCSLEMQPLLRATTKDSEDIYAFMQDHNLLIDETKFYVWRQDDFENSIKTSLFLLDWMDEKTEDELMQRYGVRPGEISYKQHNSDWLLYACEELARINNYKELLHILKHLRLRVKNGVKSELSPLLRFKGVGRTRARILFSKGVKNIKDVKKISFSQLCSYIGSALARKLKEEVGINISEKEEESEKKRLVEQKSFSKDSFQKGLFEFSLSHKEKNEHN